MGVMQQNIYITFTFSSSALEYVPHDALPTVCCGPDVQVLHLPFSDSIRQPSDDSVPLHFQDTDATPLTTSRS